MQNYHSVNAISASGLKLLNKTPAHYYARYLDPLRTPDEPTPAMILGTQTHCAILEPAEFDNRYCVMPDGIDRRTKEGKALYEQILATGKQPIKCDDFDKIESMRESAHSHRLMKVIFSKLNPIAEKEFYFDIDGTAAKMKPDLIVEPCADFPNGVIIDLKTCSDASPEEFPHSVWNLDMAIQAAFYVDNFQAIYKTESAPQFIWLAVESKAPYLCAMYSIPESLMFYGRKDYKRLLDIYRDCMKNNVWQGYSELIMELALPSWAESIINQSEEDFVC